MKIEEFKGKLHLVPYTKTFSIWSPWSPTNLCFKKTEQNISESKNASSFLLNGQISVPEWCVDFFWNTLSFTQLHRCHALSLQQHKNYQKKKVFSQQRYLLLPPSPRWKPIALTESGKFDMLTPSLAHWNKTVHSNYFSTLVKWSLCPGSAPWRWQRHPTHFRLQQLITVTTGNFMLLPLHTHWGHLTSVLHVLDKR